MSRAFKALQSQRLRSRMLRDAPALLAAAYDDRRNELLRPIVCQDSAEGLHE